VEYVEVRGKTVDVAVEAALEELGIDRDRAEIEVIQEPEKGFLGMGGKDAVVRVKARPAQKRRRRRRRGERDNDQSSSDDRRNQLGGGDGTSPNSRRETSRNERDSRSEETAAVATVHAIGGPQMPNRTPGARMRVARAMKEVHEGGNRRVD
jgi:predicted RNA-binding protein Jag